MRADTFFHFQSPKLYEPELEDNWSKWYSKLVKIEIIEQIQTYFPERVAFVSNLIFDKNITRWELFQEEYSGKLIEKKIIPQFVKAWAELWLECQKPENSSECLPNDIYSPEEVNVLLKKYIGYYLTIRND